ncbi:ribonuclease H family protein [Bailinhaonella thermotolerans]|uniref:Ribonuclease H n=1 Tax=Bailinhaonella thermotolerans TaxID=1070861 RepID=A0A3A4AE41_9ACTN|nr:ribonuclease H [Bailinhaonella thermotolerans]RJL23903.1 ribonuclease HI [Bailinhaonella thermotolerans]
MTSTTTGRRTVAACDGSSLANPGPAGWAWVIAGPDGSPVREACGAFDRATNNAAELTALAELLESTDPRTPLEIRMDSQYAINAASVWIHAWKRNGWRTAAGRPVLNLDLIQRIDRLLAGRDVHFVWVRAHRADGDPLNRHVDDKARQAAQDRRTALAAATSPP